MKQYALIGENLGHTISPYIHNLIFEHFGIESTYSVADISSAQLPGILGKLSTANFGGVNVTIPHKQSIMPYLDNISPEAARIGAVNTIKIENDATVGFNTDYYGFGFMMEQADIEVSGKNIAIFGSGGAARSVIAYLNDHGAANIHVFSKTRTRFDSLKATFPFIQCSLLENTNKIQGHLAINTTPVGMFPKTFESVIDEKIADRFETLADIVYNPIETKFIKMGNRLGKTTQNGLHMLIGQAIKAQEIFQNITISPSVGAEIYNSIVANRILEQGTP